MSKQAQLPHYWDDAKARLSDADPVMQRIIASYPASDGLRSRGDAFHTLMRSIVGQQISVKAADALWAKMEQAIEHIAPEHIHAAEEELLRSCGFSRQKVAYSKNIAQFFLEEGAHAPHYWQALEDEEVLRKLVSIKGVGQWTAEMFLMFHLMRPDVLPLGDLGLVKAIDLHYRKRKALDKTKMLKLAKKWQPYRSVATWYLWRSLDPVPVEY